jgi:hypothetical protein
VRTSGSLGLKVGRKSKLSSKSRSANRKKSLSARRQIEDSLDNQRREPANIHIPGKIESRVSKISTIIEHNQPENDTS